MTLSLQRRLIGPGGKGHLFFPCPFKPGPVVHSCRVNTEFYGLLHFRPIWLKKLGLLWCEYIKASKATCSCHRCPRAKPLTLDGQLLRRATQFIVASSSQWQEERKVS